MTLKACFAAGILSAAAGVIYLAAGGSFPAWVQVCLTFSLLGAFTCLYLAERTIDGLDATRDRLIATVDAANQALHDQDQVIAGLQRQRRVAGFEVRALADMLGLGALYGDGQAREN